MPRWLLKLKGQAADLEEFPYWYPAGDPYAYREGDDIYLSCSRLDEVTSAREAYDTGLAILEEASAIISLIWPSFIAPGIENVVHESDDGTRQTHHILMGANSIIRIKCGNRDCAPLKAGMTEAQWYQAVIQRNSHLQTALLLWADTNRTWPRLYRILEEIEQHKDGTKADKAGLCKSVERQRFTRSANTAAVAGRDSRHADRFFEAPSDPMSLEEATSFIRSIIQTCLRQEADHYGAD